MRLDLAIRPALESVCTATASADAAAAAGRDDAELRRVAAPIIDALLRDESINLSLVPDGLVSRRRVSHRRPRRGPTPSPHLPSGALGSKIQPRPPPLRLRCPPSSQEREIFLVVIRLLRNVAATGLGQCRVDTFGLRADCRFGA